jgi:CBS domain containing-hemolysin-like protein
MLLLVNTVSIVAAASATVLLVRRIRPDAVGLISALFVLTALLIGMRILFRALAGRSPDSWAMRLAPPAQGLSVLLYPILSLMRGLDQMIGGQRGKAVTESVLLTEDGIRFLIDIGGEESAIEEDEKEMIAAIVELGETLVREVMVPRIDVVSLPVDTPMVDALDVIIESGYSRIPVYEETLDNIVGILYAKDLLGRFRRDQKDALIGEMLRTTYFVPESAKVDDLLRDLQRRRVHAAIVVDEYGGTAGLVTIEDLLEEIVGEIQDEYDREEPLVQPVAEGEYLLSARCNLDDASDVLGVDLPSEGGDSLGGFIYTQLGRVPVVGDEVIFDSIRMTVLSVDGRRVTQLRAQIGEPAV